MRVKVVELSRSKESMYAELSVEDNGRLFKLVINIEHRTKSGFSTLQVHCDCEEFRGKGICKHVLSALSSITGTGLKVTFNNA